jgi:hypothetical protein
MRVASLVAFSVMLLFAGTAGAHLGGGPKATAVAPDKGLHAPFAGGRQAPQPLQPSQPSAPVRPPFLR